MLWIPPSIVQVRKFKGLRVGFALRERHGKWNRIADRAWRAYFVGPDGDFWF